MEWASSELTSVLTFLLPGFITAWVFYALTSFPKPTQFERVVQALIFTMLVQALVLVLEWVTDADTGTTVLARSLNENSLLWSVIVALGLGLAFSWSANHDRVHSLLRRLKITHLTSYPSEWFREFATNETYVVLHLEGERRLYGWPEQWPSNREAGEFSIAEPEWLVGNERIALSGVMNIVIPGSQVEIVEFMDLSYESTEGKPDGDEAAEPAPEQEATETAEPTPSRPR